MTSPSLPKRSTSSPTVHEWPPRQPLLRLGLPWPPRQERDRIKRRDQVLDMGIDKYNEEWKTIIIRTGRWIDFKNDYKTMDLKFMETVWWDFAQLYQKGLVYNGFKVMTYSTGCKTPLSNFEVVGDPYDAAFVAWTTTTPWTLSSNLALCVNPNFVYVKVRSKYSGKTYVVAELRLSDLPTEKPKSNAANVPSGDSKKSKTNKDLQVKRLKILQQILRYEPLFNYFLEFSDAAFRLIANNYVTDDNGTGIVHCAPAFGEMIIKFAL
ncbi:hypothetical protein CRYUN_Cryun09bG0164900 [Craigia yunnanensis]